MYLIFKDFITRLIELENENPALAAQALEIAIERFRLATITSIELRETQNILFDTEDRLITAQFEAKMAETELLRVGGILLRELDFLIYILLSNPG